jgi:class 3 adenylate cyclase
VLSIRTVVITLIVTVLLLSSTFVWLATYLTSRDAIIDAVKDVRDATHEHIREYLARMAQCMEAEVTNNMGLHSFDLLTATNVPNMRKILYSQWRKDVFLLCHVTTSGDVYGYQTYNGETCRLLQPNSGDTAKAYYYYSIDSSGDPVSALVAGWDKTPVDSLDHFSVAHTKGTLQWKNPYVFQSRESSVASSVVMSAVGAAFDSSDVFKGSVSTSVDLKDMTTLMNNWGSKVGNGFKAVAFDQYGHVLASSFYAPTTKRTWSGASFTDSLIKGSESTDDSVRDMYDHLTDETSNFQDVNSGKLHETDVDGKDVFLSMAAFAEGSDGNIKYTIVSSVEKDKVFSELIKGTLISWLVIVGIVIFFVLAGSVVIHFVSRPLQKVTKQMENTASMSYDAADVMNSIGRSVVKDVFRVQVAFCALVANLEEYRAFMPSSLQERNQADGAGKGDVDKASKNTWMGDGGLDEEAAHGGGDDGVTKGQKLRMVVASLAKKTTSLSLQRSEMAILALDIHNFTFFAKRMSSQKLIEIHGEWVEKMSSVIETEGGRIVDKFQCDTIYGMFKNDQRGSTLYLQKAARAAFGCLGAMSELRRLWVCDLGIEPVHMRSALCAGKGYAGNMGSSRVRAFAIISNAMRRVNRLLQAAKEFQLPIALSSDVQDDVQRLFLCRPIGDFQFFRGSKPVRCFELVEPRSVEDPIGEQQNRIYREGFEAFVAGRLPEAIEKLGICHGYNPTDRVTSRMINIAKQHLERTSVGDGAQRDDENAWSSCMKLFPDLVV